MSDTVSQKKGIVIALVAQDGDSLSSFHRLVNSPGVKFAYYSSLDQLKKSRDSLTVYSGIIFELQTLVSASTEEKDFVRELKRRAKMPTLELAIPGEAADAAHVLGLQQRLSAFLTRAFDFSAETNLREHPRKPVILKVKIFPTPDAGAGMPMVRAVTSDISEGGCFVVSFGDWSHIKEIYIEFNDSGVLVPCQVMWDRKWEQSDNKFPGFGVKFSDTGDAVKTNLEKILAKIDT